MLQSLSKIGRSLAVLSLIVLSLLIAFPVQAGGATFAGTLNASDSWALNYCQSYYETYSFSVTSTGDYTVRFATPSFQNATRGTFIGAFASTNTSPGTYENVYSAYVEGDRNVPNTFTLTAGQSYYLIVLDCVNIAYGFTSSITYSVTISGPGDVNGGNAPTDMDSDGVADSSDNCPNNANSNQLDTDGDDIGDVCDSTPNGDDDSDGIDNAADNCPSNANSDQQDTDSDDIGDVCDPYPNDADGDTIDDSVDNCLGTPNPSQEDTDGDTIGDACDPNPNDADGDTIDDSVDNCLGTPNPSQEDTDGDTIGDACDTTPSGDNDGDGVENDADNCVNVYNPAQEDTDGDKIGDACDGTPSGDDDADGVDNAVDNCPNAANPAQVDNDHDGIGNRCDSSPYADSDNDGLIDREDECPLNGDAGFGVGENGCPPHIVLPPDERVNWQYGDLNVVVYRHEDGVAVYCYNGNTWLGMHVNQALVDNWDASQAQDVPVLEVDHAGCRTAFYILDSGEYQINIWTFEGKRYEIIADNLHFDNATMRYFDPNE